MTNSMRTHRRDAAARPATPGVPTARVPGAALLLTALLTLPAVAAPAALAGQAPETRPLTWPERTDYLETSRYADVMAFIDAVAGADVLHPTTFGYTLEGRPLPLVVAGKGLADASPGAVRATGRTRVLVLANIHGGEVEGKEAAQRLLRAFAAGEHEEWLDSLVVLVAPIYNADGNERVSVLNRTRQNGPLGGVGQRENAQGLDLNRDNMKLESPEARSLAALLTAWDPHLLVDLHTTNGTRHAYHITYSPPLHPNTPDAIDGYLRERWLPAVTRAMREEHGFHSYYYGNAYAPGAGDYGWYTFDHRPRFTTTYVGLRNRFAILSEAYAYASFQERVDATAAFVEEILDFAHAHAGEIRGIVAAADAAGPAGGELGVRAAFERGDEVEILMGATEERLSPYSGRRYHARQDVVDTVRMREYGTFRVTESARVPAAYLVPPALGAVADLLRLHGVPLERLSEARTLGVERFVIDSTRQEPREFQGHRERELFGRWAPAEVTLPAGTWVVRTTGHPLGRLVFALLEPRSDDGVLNWNLLDDVLAEAPAHYPILRRHAGDVGETVETVETVEPGGAGGGSADSGAPDRGASSAASPGWERLATPAGAEIRGLAAAPGGVAWTGGRGGVWTRTADGGRAWSTGVIPGADSLFLVDVHAVDAREAYVLGTHFDGGLARIYHTRDAGGSWTTPFEDRRPGAFYDGLAFWDARRGVAFGDAVEGRLTIVRTEDGRRWVPAERVPAALEGEGGFAASGTAVAVAGDGHAWIGTGAGPRARVLRTRDGGRSWTAAETPLPAGPTAGIFGIAFRDTLNGVAVGGDYTDTTSAALNVLRTRDGGRSWELVARSAPPGVRYGVAYVPGSSPAMLVAVGPSGSGYSLDDGATWTPLDRTGYNTVAFSGPAEGWAAGVGGLVARWR